MTEQEKPEALRLADALERGRILATDAGDPPQDAAAELRRLHADSEAKAEQIVMLQLDASRHLSQMLDLEAENHSLRRRRREHRLMRGMKHLEILRLKARIAELEAEASKSYWHLYAMKEQELGYQGDLAEATERIAELEEMLLKECQHSADQKLRANQMTEQHRMQAALNSEARHLLAQRERPALTDVLCDRLIAALCPDFCDERFPGDRPILRQLARDAFAH